MDEGKRIVVDKIIQIIRNNKSVIKDHLLKFKNELAFISDNLDEFKLQNLGDKIIKEEVDDNKIFSITKSGLKMVTFSMEIYHELEECFSKSLRKMYFSVGLLKEKNLFFKFPNLEELIGTDYWKMEKGDYLDKEKQIFKLKLPKEGNISEDFKKNYLVVYSNLENINLNFATIYDKRAREVSSLAVFNMKSESEIKEVFINSKNIKEIANILEWLKDENYTIEKIILSLNNETYPDIKLLQKYDSIYNIEIDYNDMQKTDLDGFISMRFTIDWYKEIINGNNLSPFEIAIFAYDIVKTFKYREGTEESDARFIPNIINTGNIVCVGFSKLFEAILKEFGIRTIDLNIPPLKGEKDGHRRTAIRLDDDKYNIHGIFAVDVTWDREITNLSLVTDYNEQTIIRRNGVKESDKVIKEYDALSLYNYFLIPYKDYKIIFSKEELPEIFQLVEDKEVFFDIWDAYSSEVYKLFDKINKPFIKNYILNSNKPNLEQFKSALYVVRKAEGYIEKDLNNHVSDVLQLNKMLDEYNIFFEDENENKINKN